MAAEDLRAAAADSQKTARGRRQFSDSVHEAVESSPLRRSGAANFMFSGAAATEMLRQAAKDRKVARHRHAQAEERQRLLSLRTAQGVLRRFAHDPTMERLAAEGALPAVGKGFTDPAIFRALPKEKRSEILRHMRTVPKPTPLSELVRPKRLVDRSTLKFGKDKTSAFA